jgi:hypothetical protein
MRGGVVQRQSCVLTAVARHPATQVELYRVTPLLTCMVAFSVGGGAGGCCKAQRLAVPARAPSADFLLLTPMAGAYALLVWPATVLVSLYMSSTCACVSLCVLAPGCGWWYVCTYLSIHASAKAAWVVLVCAMHHVLGRSNGVSCAAGVWCLSACAQRAVPLTRMCAASAAAYACVCLGTASCGPHIRPTLSIWRPQRAALLLHACISCLRRGWVPSPLLWSQLCTVQGSAAGTCCSGVWGPGCFLAAALRGVWPSGDHGGMQAACTSRWLVEAGLKGGGALCNAQVGLRANWRDAVAAVLVCG